MGLQRNLGTDPHDLRMLHPRATRRYTDPEFRPQLRQTDGEEMRMLGEKTTSYDQAVAFARNKLPVYLQMQESGYAEPIRRIDTLDQLETRLPGRFGNSVAVIRQVYPRGPMPIAPPPRSRMQEPAYGGGLWPGRP